MADDDMKSNEMDEEALNEAQKMRGEAISAQELDAEALDTVSGGGTGLSCYAQDDCDNYFKTAGCDKNYWHPNGKDESDACKKYYGCNLSYHCDEAWWTKW